MQDLDALSTSDTPKQELQKYIELWTKKSNVLEIIVDHEEIDIINNYLWTMQGDLEQDQRDNFLVTLDVTHKMIEHIALKNSLQLNNIF